MNDMDKSAGAVEQTPGSLRRRDFLTKAAAAGAITWATPMILSRPAHAADGSGGTPGCQPTFTFECLTYDCEQGNKMMPGFRIVTSACPCSETTPPQKPVTCLRITNLSATCTDVPVAYGEGTLCSPQNAGSDVILSTGDWECFDPAFPIFFGRPRTGSIPEIPNDCTFTFRLGVWAGGCPDADSTDDAFVCQTFNATIVWDQGDSEATCTFTAAPADQSLCTFAPPDQSPCGAC